MEMVLPKRALPGVLDALRDKHPYEEPAFDLYDLAARRSAEIGQGRILELAKPATIEAMLRRVKKHLGLKRVRVATAAGHAAGDEIRTVALCAGAGGSVLSGVAADLYLTGEMRHHDVLEAREAGTSVILCDHTNTERGFLEVFRAQLAALLDDAVEVKISEQDADPLNVV